MACHHSVSTIRNLNLEYVTTDVAEHGMGEAVQRASKRDTHQHILPIPVDT